MNAFLYLLGAAACIVWRWMRWLNSQPPGIQLNSFWRARMATNVSSLVVSMMMMGAYLTGAMSKFIRAIAPQELVDKVPMMYGEWWAAPIAGFAITLCARLIVKKFSDKVGATDEDQ